MPTSSEGMQHDPADLGDAFTASMNRLGPFEDRPALAVAVSGGADSMALALLARDWVLSRHGSVRALVVDHGLRPESASEAGAAVGRLEALRIPVTLLTLSDLQRGKAMAERARNARYEALTDACRSVGLHHLLLGHHAADQAETLMMRALRQSGSAGLAGMPALAETRHVRLLRPLLAIDPASLRAFLQARGIGWVEDPSNRDLQALRPRLRYRANGAATSALAAAARWAGAARALAEEDTAADLGALAAIRPEGFAVIPALRLNPVTLSALVRAIGGSAYPPALAQIIDLAAAPQPATVAGVRIIAVPGALTLLREEAAMAGPITAGPGIRWDGRMRLRGEPPDGTTIGALAQDAAAFRKRSPLPSAVLRTLPALRLGKTLLAVPHLGYVSDSRLASLSCRFDPRRPAAGAVFAPI
jgi:tRNA(Ile)-lysidine synthase